MYNKTIETATETETAFEYELVYNFNFEQYKTSISSISNMFTTPLDANFIHKQTTKKHMQ